MKNVSLFLKLVLSNTIIMITFMIVFISGNYDTVYKQMSFLEDEKFLSIARTVEPVVSINLSLGIESGYVDAITQLLKTHPEIVSITLSDIERETIYEVEQLSTDKFTLSSEHLHTLEIETHDKLLNQTSGFITIYYTYSSYLDTIISEYKTFLMMMFSLFILLLFILTQFIYVSIKPLQKLANTLRSYIPGKKIQIPPMEGKNEITVINNATMDMLAKINEHTHTLEDQVKQRTKELHNTNKALMTTQNNLKELNLDLESRVEEEVEKRIRSEKELAHKSRLASMGEMIDNIAHQWRQPLMNINAILLNIDRAYELNKLDQEYLDRKIHEATNLTNHMSQTIEDFRTFFRQDKEKQPINLHEVFTQSIELLTSIIKETMVYLNIPKNATILGYRNELIQVIISIINNATEVLDQRNIQEKKIFISVEDEPHSIKILIEDNAGGIDSKHINHIFEPYHTTKHQNGGTGLGLYICKVIIEEHMKGSIQVSNTEKGAQFIITLKKEFE